MTQLPLPISTGRLTIRALQASDLDQLHDIQRRAEVARYLYWEPRSRAEVSSWLRQAAPIPAMEAESQVLVLASVERDSQRLAGTLNLWLRSIEHRQGEIGFVLHPDLQGRGLAGEGAAELLRLGFETLRLHRICGRCDRRNQASARVMERLGMRREAALLENEWFKGEWSDELIFAIREDEWRASRADPHA